MKKVLDLGKSAARATSQFFKRIYFAVYMFFARKVLAIRNFFSRKVNAIKLLIHNKHVAFYTWIVCFLVFHCRKYMLRLIDLKGLDPNPPPPPPPEPEVRRPQFYMPYVPSWVSESFKDPSKHPLYGGRTAEKPEYLPKTSDLPKVSEVSDLQVAISEFNQFVESSPMTRGSLRDVLTQDQKDRARDVRLSELMDKLKEEDE